MPNIKLIGFKKAKANELIPKIAEAIRENTNLADKAVITNYPGSTCVSAANTIKWMPYFCICNTTSESGTTEEFEQLTEVLKPFGFDIEWGEIKKFFPAPGFKEWDINTPVTEDEALEALAKEFGVPKIDLREVTPDPEVIGFVDPEVIRKHKALPIRLEGKNLIVAMVDPLNLIAIDNIRLATGYDVEPYVCNEKTLNAMIQKLLPPLPQGDF